MCCGLLAGYGDFDDLRTDLFMDGGLLGLSPLTRDWDAADVDICYLGGEKRTSVSFGDSS